MLQAFLVSRPSALVYLLAAPDPAAPADLAAGGGRRRPGGGVGLVGGRRPAHAGRRPALRRRLAEQQPPQPDLRVQRLRQAVGQRGGQRGRRGRTGACRVAVGPAPGGSALFQSDLGGQISWLLPAALILLVAGLVLTVRAPRTDRTRAAFLLWGGSLVVTGAGVQPRPGDHPPVLHGGAGTARSAPWSAWARRPVGRAARRCRRPAVLASALAATAVWALRSCSTGARPGSRGSRRLVAGGGRRRRRLLLLPPRLAAAVGGWPGGGGRRRGAGRAGGVRTQTRPAPPDSGAIPWPARPSPAAGSEVPAGGPGGGFGRFPGRSRRARRRPGCRDGRRVRRRRSGPARPAAGTGGVRRPGGLGRFGGPVRRRSAGAAGGVLDGSTPGPALVKALRPTPSRYRWVAATVELQLGRRLPARHRRPGDGNRRVQRHRSGADTRPVRAVRRATATSTTSSPAAASAASEGSAPVRGRTTPPSSRRGCGPTTHRRPSAGSPSTT